MEGLVIGLGILSAILGWGYWQETHKRKRERTEFLLKYLVRHPTANPFEISTLFDDIDLWEVLRDVWGMDFREANVLAGEFFKEYFKEPLPKTAKDWDERSGKVMMKLMKKRKKDEAKK